MYIYVIGHSKLYDWTVLLCACVHKQHISCNAKDVSRTHDITTKFEQKPGNVSQ